VLASEQPLPLDTLRRQLAALDLLNQWVDPTTVLDGATLSSYVGDAPLLTDDYAPVDQLLTRP
jgi:hypothetical protein